MGRAMKVIGITGGIGSGKSRVLAFLEEELHGVICQADDVARKLEQKGQACYKEIVACFGRDILEESGEIDRAKLAGIVFADTGKLQQLNEIVHPAVKAQICREIEEERQKGTRAFFLEVALLLEDHYDLLCDEIWYIHTEERVRRERLKASRGYDDAKIDAILATQLSEEVFMAHADHVIENSGSFEETCARLRALGEQLDETM